MAVNWLTYLDIKPCIDRLTKNKSIKYIFNVKDEKDVDRFIGKIIQSFQEWEYDVKNLLSSLNVDKDSLVIKGIGDIIAHLFNKNYFTEQEGKDLRDVVKIRNYITHHFYLDFTYSDFYSISNANDVLNKIYLIINQTIEIIRNKISKEK